MRLRVNHWKKVNDQIKEEPEKEYDHAMDALRYAIMGYIKGIKKQPRVRRL